MKVASTKRVLVIGGSGFLGTAVCNQLAQEGFQITVPTRRIDSAKHLTTLPTCRVVKADIHDRAALSRLLEGQDAVVNLLGVLHSKSGRPYGQSFRQNHVEFPKALCAVMQSRRIKRLVHVSALGVGSKQGAPSQYLRSKADGEAAVKDSTLDWTILRPSVVFGREDNFLNLFASLCKLSTLMPLGGAATRFQPVAVEDVALAVRMCLTDPGRAKIHATFDLAGPETLTLAELVKLAGRAVGKEPLIIPLPTVVAKLQAFFLECLPGEPLMSRDNVNSLKIDNVSCGGHLFPLPQYTPLSVTAPEYLRQRHLRGEFDEFRRSAHRDT